MAMLEVKNLSKSFGSLCVLKDISFNVEKRRCCGYYRTFGFGKIHTAPLYKPA